MTKRENELIGLLHREVKPALGCTEPMAVALACAKAAELLGPQAGEGLPDMDIEVSGNILKNGMGVGIPGTDKVGLHIAAALGAICGNSRYGLEVLRNVEPAHVLKAKEMVRAGKVQVRVAEDVPLLYIKATLRLGGSSAFAEIEGEHDRIVRTGKDGKVLPSGCNGPSSSCGEEKEIIDYHLTVKEIYSFTGSAAYDDIKFILADRDLNLALAEAGLSNRYGLGVGKAIRENRNGVFGDDFMSYAMALTAAASDARMAGCKLPAMSNSGSGNQGITVSMPVIAYALRYAIDDERLARALILSNLVAIHIKGYLGRLSALCGCVVASTGSACGLVWLRGGTYAQVCAAIKNMIGNITGMVCDGAKVGCAMKVASGVSCAVQSAMLALDGICVSETDGIIDKDIEKTIRNLGSIGSSGMKSTDRLIQEIMVCK